MKITPLEIRQKSFEKKMRGYDKDEVNAFLVSLSQEWERLNADNKEMQIRIESLNKDVQKLREVESSLFKTLKVAEDTSSGMKDQARKDAELHLREAHLQAEALLRDAREQVRNMLEEAEEIVKDSLAEVKDQVKTIELEYKQAEHLKENFLFELKNLAQETLHRAEKYESKKTSFQKIVVPEAESIVNAMDLEFEVGKTTPATKAKTASVDESEKAIEVDFEIAPSIEQEEIEAVTSQEEVSVKETSVETPAPKKGGSFFDSL